MYFFKHSEVHSSWLCGFIMVYSRVINPFGLEHGPTNLTTAAEENRNGSGNHRLVSSRLNPSLPQQQAPRSPPAAATKPYGPPCRFLVTTRPMCDVSGLILCIRGCRYAAWLSRCVCCSRCDGERYRGFTAAQSLDHLTGERGNRMEEGKGGGRWCRLPPLFLSQTHKSQLNKHEAVAHQLCLNPCWLYNVLDCQANIVVKVTIVHAH